MKRESGMFVLTPSPPSLNLSTNAFTMNRLSCWALGCFLMPLLTAKNFIKGKQVKHPWRAFSRDPSYPNLVQTQMF